MLPLGSPLPGFSLPDTLSGKTVSNADHTGRPVLLMFICNHCPYVIHINQAFKALDDDFAGIDVVAISSNRVDRYPQDAPPLMKKLAQDLGWEFPYAFDEDQSLARALDAACTPDFFLFDASHVLVYRGQLDNSSPGNGVPVTGEHLRAAMTAVSAGEAVTVEQLPAMGCGIKWF
jgi:thiol-disulfide isomerase/thioredoxin